MTESENNQKHKYLLFELTKRCQNECVFCYNVWKEDGDYPEAELSTKDVLRLLEKVIHESPCEIMALTGGEPLLKKGFFEIASFLASMKVTTVLISNGMLLSERTVASCMESGIRYFEVSLHSHDRMLHDELVGRSGSFEEAIDAVINIKKLGGRVNTVFVATKKSIEGFDKYVELNALLKVDWILFNRVACGGNCIKNWPEIAPSPMQIQETFDVGAPLAERYKIGLSAGVQIQPCLVDLSKYKNVRPGYCPLNNGAKGGTYFVIDPAGNLRVCNRWKVTLGNLLEEHFEDLVNRKEIEEIGNAIPDYCLDCKLAEICAGGCKADAFSYYGTLDRPDPYLEAWRQEAVKP